MLQTSTKYISWAKFCFCDHSLCNTQKNERLPYQQNNCNKFYSCNAQKSSLAPNEELTFYCFTGEINNNKQFLINCPLKGIIIMFQCIFMLNNKKNTYNLKVFHEPQRSPRQKR